jgi:hypothetical protein
MEAPMSDKDTSLTRLNIKKVYNGALLIESKAYRKINNTF